MKPLRQHRWDLTPAEARQLQEQIRGRVILADDAAEFFVPKQLIAVDVGYDKVTDRCAAALVVWDVAANKSLLELTHVAPSTFPYVPGLLSFREIPPLLPLFEKLSVGRFGSKRHGKTESPPRPPSVPASGDDSIEIKPELILVDGQGIAHPRRIGLATHLGLLFDCPTLGWAKSRLIGTYKEPAARRGVASPLMDHDEQIGWVLRSRANCRVTFISPGHRVSLARSLDLARALPGPYRLSDPARRAHTLTRLAMAQAAVADRDSIAYH